MPRERFAIFALLAGNFVVATCATILVALVPDLSTSLQASPERVGQLVTLSGLVMCVVAPAAGLAARRISPTWLLGGALLVQGSALILAATQTTLTGLMVARALQVVGPAIFTAQAAATVPLLVSKERTGWATATIYLGWPLALVLGMPAATWLSGHWGWAVVFYALGGLTLLMAALVMIALPDRQQLPSIGQHPGERPLLAGLWPCLATTGMASAAQLMVLTYFTTYAKLVLGAGSGGIALVLLGFGLLGTAGVSLIGKVVDRLDADRAVLGCLGLMAVSMMAWPLASTLWLAGAVLVPWALSAFALSAAQQARLIAMSPGDGPRTVGLNTAFVYLGQALGAALGGYWVSRLGFATLGGGALLLVILALGSSFLASRATSATSA